jgi:hypothetical protein
MESSRRRRRRRRRMVMIMCSATQGSLAIHTRSALFVRKINGRCQNFEDRVSSGIATNLPGAVVVVWL